MLQYIEQVGIWPYIFYISDVPYIYGYMTTGQARIAILKLFLLSGHSLQQETL